MENINTKFIKLNSINDILEFVKKASNVEGDVDVKKGKYVIDAKSPMGMFSVDCSQGCVVSYPASEKDFDEYLNKFI